MLEATHGSWAIILELASTIIGTFLKLIKVYAGPFEQFVQGESLSGLELRQEEIVELLATQLVLEVMEERLDLRHLDR